MTSCMTWLVPAAGPVPVTIRIDAAEVWADFRDDVTRWRRAARVDLGG
jgi:hypothetical protein